MAETPQLRRFPRRTLPTLLKSADIRRQIGIEVQERSFFSAQTLEESVLEKYQQRIQEMLAPKQVKREDRRTLLNPEGFVTEAPDAASVRLEIQQLLKDAGYQPEEDKTGTLQDLSSESRINLVVDHNVEEARAYGHYLQSTDADFADAWPAQELVRFRDSMVPRHWDTIWVSACEEADDQEALTVFRSTGRMIARKDSRIWLIISDFGRPWPPFKFGSGMGLRDISRREAMDLGIINRDDRIEVPRLAFNETQEAA